MQVDYKCFECPLACGLTMELDSVDDTPKVCPVSAHAFVVWKPQVQADAVFVPPCVGCLDHGNCYHIKAPKTFVAECKAEGYKHFIPKGKGNSNGKGR